MNKLSEISDQLLKQRLRNRIIERLELLSAPERLDEIGTSELLEGWFDYVDEERIGFFDEPTFSWQEVASLRRFHNLIEAIYSKIPKTWNIKELRDCREWNTLVASATEELQVFRERGLLSEEVEVT